MRYYVNEIPDEEDGYHEVHNQKCFWIPQAAKRIYLGEFQGEEACCQAVDKALKIYGKSQGCKQCCCEKCNSYALYDYCTLPEQSVLPC